MKRFARKRRGQFRLIEVLLAAVTLFTAFTAAVALTSSSRMHVLQQHADLDRVGQNILLRLAESGVIDSTVEETPSGTTFNNLTIQNTITRSLPPLTYYSLEIYGSAAGGQMPLYNERVGGVSNTWDSFSGASEVSSSSFLYTSSSGRIYFVVLSLVKAG